MIGKKNILFPTMHLREEKGWFSFNWSTFQFRYILNIETWFLRWKYQKQLVLYYIQFLRKLWLDVPNDLEGWVWQKYQWKGKTFQMLSRIILQYYKSYSLISHCSHEKKKIKFLETVKLTERTMLLQNYLCLKSSYNLIQMASTSSPQLTPGPFVPTTSLYSPIFLSTNNSRPVGTRTHYHQDQ